MAERSPLLDLLAGTLAVEQLDGEGGSLLLAEARASGLLGRVANLLASSAQAGALAPHLQAQLSAATIHANRFRQDVWRELGAVEQALSALRTPVILLKGASYVLTGLPAAQGRVFSDIDILVAKNQMACAEAALMLGGWAIGKLDAYDQRYYRQWAHEIPPMTHLQRGTTIDLHHSLVMPTCRVQVDSSRMIAAAVPVRGSGFWWRLQDEDMVLHAASHLMLNAEFDRGLRDIGDIDSLYRHFTSLSVDFPARLIARAHELGLAPMLTQVLWLAWVFFKTPLPAHLLAVENSLFLRLVARAASTRHPDTRPAGQNWADLALLLREMYLRLPNRLLLAHLLHKMSFSVSKVETVTL
ncbi:MAG: nucleotidyltransferase domain-containing protein [Rhodoferax sp.]